MAKSPSKGSAAVDARLTEAADIEALADAESDGDGATINAPRDMTEGVAGDGSGEADSAVRSGLVGYVDDPRAAIARSIDANRGTAEAAAEDDATITEEGDADEADEADEAPVVKTVASKAAGPKVNVADLDPEAIVVVKVNGQMVEVTAGDLVSNAQKYIAGDDYFRQGKQFLDNARRAQDAAPADTRDRTDTGQNQPDRRGATDPALRAAKPTAEERKAKLLEVADRIQTGTPEEGAAALEELIASLPTSAADGAVTQGDVARMVDQTYSNRELETRAFGEVNEALETIASKHAALQTNEDLAPALFTRGYKDMVEAARKAGVPDEDFNQAPRDVIHGYAVLRQDPRFRDQLPSLSSLFDGAATRLEKSLGIKPGSSDRRDTQRAGQTGVVRTTEAREVRRTTTIQQPRPAATRFRAPDPGAQERDRDNSGVIERMKADREAGVALRR